MKKGEPVGSILHPQKNPHHLKGDGYFYGGEGGKITYLFHK